MAPSNRDLQLTKVNGDGGDDREDEWLLNNYDEKMEGTGDGMRRIQVGVTGMTCAACSNSVEGALMGLNGVVKASVALLQNKANVIFYPNLVKFSSLAVLNLVLRFVASPLTAFRRLCVSVSLLGGFLLILLELLALTNFMGFSFLLCLLGGFLSDTFLSRLATCLIFGILEVLALVMITVQAYSKNLHPLIVEKQAV